MSGRVLLLAIVGASLFAGAALAEKPLSSADDLRGMATDVIVGQVAAVYERVESDANWKSTSYVAEIRVQKCEKGDVLRKGDLAYVRYWRRSWIGKGNPPPGTSGHIGLPSTKDTVRVYLARNAYDGFTNENHDGGFNVIGVNGFEKVEAPKTK
jgi:hypothetical protein